MVAEERDEELGEALDKLPVPDPDPEFWERLRKMVVGEAETERE